MDSIGAFEQIVSICFEDWKANKGKMPLEISVMLFGNLKEKDENIVHVIITSLVACNKLKQSEFVEAIARKNLTELLQKRCSYLNSDVTDYMRIAFDFNGKVPQLVSDILVKRPAMSESLLTLSQKLHSKNL